jgi:hypothetical protein
MRREPDPVIRPQMAGLVLADDVLMLAQAAAGDADLVEWISEAIRMRATPLASTLTKQPRRPPAKVEAPADAGKSRSAINQAAYRERKRLEREAAKAGATDPVTSGAAE